MKTRKHVRYIDHLGAYLWAAKHVYGKRILEIGSGEGYGAQLLSLFVTKIEGIDSSPAFTRRAQSNKYHCPARFQQANLEVDKIDFGDAQAVVAFEILEHLINPHHFLSQIPAGVPLLFSVPHNYPHPLHVTDFNSWADVHKMVSPHFKETQIFWMKDGVVYDHEVPFDTDTCRYVGIAVK